MPKPPTGGPTDPVALRRRFLRLTGLNILANVTVPLAGLVDTAMLGHLDSIRFLAGVALGGIIFDLIYWTFGFLRMGATGTTAQALGQGDDEEVERILHRSLVLALAAGLVLWAGRGVLEDVAFRLLSGDPEVEAAGREYYRARIWGAPATLANLAFLGWFLGREESRVALAMTLVASLSNVLLNLLFIVELGLAARGAGIASALAQVAMLLLALEFYRRRRLPRPDPSAIDRQGLWNRQAFRQLLGFQGDILVRTLCLVGSFAVFTDASARLGTQILAANTLLVRLLTLVAHFVDGAAFAIESLAGRFFGAGHHRALRQLLSLAHRWGLGFAALCALVLVVLPGPLLGLLTSHQEVVDLALRYLPWLIVTLVLGAPAYVFDGFFLGLTAGATLRKAMLLSSLLVFAPLATFAVSRGDADLLWLAMAAFTAARVVTLGVAARGLPIWRVV